MRGVNTIGISNCRRAAGSPAPLPRSPASLHAAFHAFPIGITMIPSRRWEFLAMANVLVRDLDDEVLKQLKAAAKAHGRSLQAEIHDVLQRASTRNLAHTRRLSTRWLKRLRKSSQSESSVMIRQDRDKR